jgi:hypothetical protein
MASPAPQVRLEPSWLDRTRIEGSWWPSSGDPGVEVRTLVPVLEHVRGPVKRLLLGVAGWTARPPRVEAAGHSVSIGYMAGQSPTVMKVLCADGGTFIMRVTPPASR